MRQQHFSIGRRRRSQGTNILLACCEAKHLLQCHTAAVHVLNGGILLLCSSCTVVQNRVVVDTAAVHVGSWSTTAMSVESDVESEIRN